jgi:hypothetical protein
VPDDQQDEATLGWRQEGVATIRRAELTDGETSMTAANDLAVRRALEIAGVEFIDENGGGPGVRLRKHQPAKQPK